MFGKKKREQEAQEAERRAEEAERAAREARAEADAIQEKTGRGLFGRKKRPAENREEQPQPAAAVAPPSEQEQALQPAPPDAPKESRRARRKREREEKKAEERIRELELQLQRSEKKRRSARFCDFFAFIVLLCAALLMLLGPVLKMILSQTGGLEALATVSIVAQYCLLAAIAIPAWYFVYRKNIAWKLIYFFALAGFIAGNILGLTL